MKIRNLLVLAAAAAILPGCLDSTGPEPPELTCDPVAEPSGTTKGDTLVTTSGLKILETEQGTGATVKTCQWVRVHYTGYVLGDSVPFDSSVGRSPLDFVPGVDLPYPYVGRLIQGFEQGVIGAEVGGERRVILPPSLGYGNSTSHPLRADTLVFDITIVANDTSLTYPTQ